MLDIAIKYEQELRELFFNIWHDERYDFWATSCWRDQYEASKNTWDKHEFVSLDASGKVIGYIAYEIDRNTRNVSSLSVLNFSNNKFVFGRDLYRAMTDIFVKHAFHKINFFVVCGNPVERSYDRLVLKFGGRVVGILKDHCKLADNKYYDMKMYEIMNPINDKA